MKIDPARCTGCEFCLSYCPVRAIAVREEMFDIDQEQCVECGICQRSGICPADAFYQPELKWPRSVRAAFSNPLTTHRDTNVGGRGTEEVKTNDVTGRFREGYAGVLVEMGRPGLGTTFRDLEIVSMTVARMGVEFEPQNPVTSLIADPRTGKIRDDVRDERVLSAIIGFIVENERLGEVLAALKEASTRIDTVFALGLISRVGRDGKIVTLPLAWQAGFPAGPHAKTNVGLGRPLKEEI